MVSSTRTLGIGVVGLGFMGTTHVKAYQAARNDGFPCRLIAVADPNPDRRSGRSATGNLSTGNDEESLFDPCHVRGYEAPEQLFADDDIHLVSICTYTDSHIDLATKALLAGKHVLLEKPVALSADAIVPLLGVVTKAGRLCMPAMCMRFWPGWEWLKDVVSKSTYGALRTARFERLGSGPGWASEFYRNDTRSGGALFDLHIHDTDFVHWLFGAPAAVSSSGSRNHVHTTFRYHTGPAAHALVTAEGGWSVAPSGGFRMKYLLNFEKATIEFDLSKDPTVTVYHADRAEPMSFACLGGYDLEVRHLIECITHDRRPRATLEDALAVTKTIEAELRSLQSGTVITVE
jgi:predicted dehydrogenase